MKLWDELGTKQKTRVIQPAVAQLDKISQERGKPPEQLAANIIVR